MSGKEITDLPAATVLNTDDLLLIRQGALDKSLRTSILLAKTLQKSNNLSDLDSVAQARTNLDVLQSSAVLQVANNLNDVGNKSTARANLGVAIGTNVQGWSAQLDSLSANNTTQGVICQTGTNTVASRTLTQPAAGFTITNPNGIAGNPTFALSDDLSGLEALASTGFASRTASNSWAVRTLTQPAAGLTIANPSGIAADPIFALANDLAALEGLSSAGFATRTGTDTWSARTLTQPAAGFTITNPSGIGGDPIFALANDLAALEGLSSAGFAMRTGTDTWENRTLAGTANQIDVNNADGVSGNPTVLIPNDFRIPQTTTLESSLGLYSSSNNGSSLQQVKGSSLAGSATYALHMPKYDVDATVGYATVAISGGASLNSPSGCFTTSVRRNNGATPHQLESKIVDGYCKIFSTNTFNLTDFTGIWSIEIYAWIQSTGDVYFQYGEDAPCTQNIYQWNAITSKKTTVGAAYAKDDSKFVLTGNLGGTVDIIPTAGVNNCSSYTLFHIKIVPPYIQCWATFPSTDSSGPAAMAQVKTTGWLGMTGSSPSLHDPRPVYLAFSNSGGTLVTIGTVKVLPRMF